MIKTVDGKPQAWFQTQISDDWTAEYRLAMEKGRVVIAEVHIFPGDWITEQGLAKALVPAGGVTTRILRSVSTGAHVDYYTELANVIRKQGRALADFGILTTMLSSRRLKPRPPGTPRRGRKPLSDEVLLKAAQAYFHARKAGAPAPIVAAAKATKMSEARMRDLIYRARRRGFVTPTFQGRGGGNLTPEASKLLRKIARSKKPRRRRQPWRKGPRAR